MSKICERCNSEASDYEIACPHCGSVFFAESSTRPSSPGESTSSGMASAAGAELAAKIREEYIFKPLAA